MLCGKCGAENDDKAGFCRGCGAPLTSGGQGNGTAGKKPAPASMGRNKIFIIAGTAAVAVIIMAVLAGALFGGRSSGKAAGKFLDAVFKADGKALVSLMPEKMADAITDAAYNGKGEMAEALEAELKQVCALFDRYYPGWKYSYKVISEEEATSLGRIQQSYEKYGVTVSEAKNVEIEITIKYNGENDFETVIIPVVRSGRSWYFDFENCDLDDIFHFSGSAPAVGSAEKDKETNASKESTAPSSSVAESSDPDWIPEEEEPEKEVLDDGQLDLSNDVVLEYYLARDIMNVAPYEIELDVYNAAFDLVVASYKDHEYALDYVDRWDSMQSTERMAVYVLMHLGEDIGWSWYTTEFAEYVKEHVPAEDLNTFAEAVAANREAREAYEGETDIETVFREFILPQYLEHFGEE